MHRTGIDIVEISRIDAALRRFGPRFLDRVYTPAEILLCKGRPQALAVRFAGKEAVMKALGTGTHGVTWADIEILAVPSGEPTVRLRGNAATVAQRLGIAELAISLSHSREYAVATVVAASSGPY